MRQAPNNRPGVTLIELIVVLAIIAIMLALLMPALMLAQEAGRRTQCQGNLHQLGIALASYIDANRTLPGSCPEARIGGWAIAILPFMEESNLADGLTGNPPLDSPAPLALGHQRPAIMSCPSAFGGNSSIATIPASHYSAWFAGDGRVETRSWGIEELPTDSRIPWIVSPGYAFDNSDPSLMPHSGGSNGISGTGGQAHAVLYRQAH